jgi:hypothetical protein
MYGQPVAYVHGKMTKKKVSRMQYIEELKSCERVQVLYVDVMALDTKKSHLSISEPLQLTMHYGIKDETMASLGQALQSQLQVFREGGFFVIR